MFVVVGLSHHTAPIAVREQMALERELRAIGHLEGATTAASGTA